jgi:O-methyltransferase
MIKKIIPLSVKKFYHKSSWFFKNYSAIRSSSKIDELQFQAPLTYNTDGLVTCNNADFIKEPRFAQAYSVAAATNPWQGFTLQWRVYVCCYFAELVKNLEGDYVECGVNTGAYSRAVIEYIDFNKLGKTFYLLDTFEGFPEEQMIEAEKNVGIGVYGGDHYKDVYTQVQQTFKNFNVKIIKGRVPQTLAECDTSTVAYLSIDMNAVAPEIAAAEFFWDKIIKGGVMILDDYGFPLHINQKLAFDEFARKKHVQILSLPTGQGIIIKNS